MVVWTVMQARLRAAQRVPEVRADPLLAKRAADPPAKPEAGADIDAHLDRRHITEALFAARLAAAEAALARRIVDSARTPADLGYADEAWPPRLVRLLSLLSSGAIPIPPRTMLPPPR